MAIKLDLHVHTETFGKTYIDERQLAEALRRSRIDGVAITNFFSIEHALWLKGRLRDHVVIVGQEVWTREGHIIGLGLKARVDDFLSAAETIGLIHQQGGLAVAVHPFLHLGVGRKVAALPFDAVEVYNAAIGGFGVYNHFGARLAARMGIGGIAASDTTSAQWIGVCHTEVMADGHDNVPEAIRAGRVHFVRRPMPIPWGFIARCLLNFKDIAPCPVHPVPCPHCGYSMVTRLFRQRQRCLLCGTIKTTRSGCSQGHLLCIDCIVRKIRERDEALRRETPAQWPEAQL